MNYDVYQDGELIYSTAANALQIELRPGEALHAHGDPDPLTAAQWHALHIAAAVLQVDADVDAIYRAAIGNRQAEYEAAERQAQAFADAGFDGDVPPMVDDWATAKGWPAQQAAQDILQQAVQWRGAQEQIRRTRLLTKEGVRSAATLAGIEQRLAAWAVFVAAVRAQLQVA